jgi:type I restriction enzyme M protein
MLDSLTKNRINTARDILVGKVPDPKSQVEQITIALIYKFMDDMDVEAEELGGKRTFFSGEYAKYSWRKIFDPRQSGYELLNLYSEAITKMDTNPGVPKLFRDIFKNAYLPYRDPETLKSFLKIINEFEYTHSEKLGDAFEFLLSILGSQGDAGQFRTPRHIIDFMVAIIDPKKHEVILDPACGTAGFLISSYKHIIKQNSSNYIPDEAPKVISEGTQSVNEVILSTNGYNGDKLTADERRILADNMHGYDISPDMVRLSLVNMYLHGVKEPQIFEYDSLTSEDHWNEYSDVILANPPFMSPKGGIRPHKRFSVQSIRSEVLFVDYIAEHLTQDGRAAVIVPEGIIFQSANAYKQLRKMLVEKYLIGVISLPAGVFNPYSGVKTSILWLDKSLSKKTNKIIFIKINNDGFDLGAQRRTIKDNDLISSAESVRKYKDSITSGTGVDDLANNVLLIEKSKISDNGEYVLTGGRYDYKQVVLSSYTMVSLGDETLFNVESGGTPNSEISEYWNGSVKWVTLVDLPQGNFVTEIYKSERNITEIGLQKSSAKLIPMNSVIVSSRATIGRIGINRIPLATNQGFKNVIIKDYNKIIPEYLAYMMTRQVDTMDKLASGGTFKEISKTNFLTLQIPLPPLSIQKEIVSEIVNYQKIIDGARQVVKNYKPRIDIDPKWDMVELGEICENNDYKRRPVEKSIRKAGPYPYYGASGVVDYVDSYLFDGEFLLLSEDGANLLARSTPIAFSIAGKTWVNNHAHILKFESNITQRFVETYLNQIDLKNLITGMAQPKLNQAAMNKILIPLPDLELQTKIVSRIDQELTAIKANEMLIESFEKQVKNRIAKVWGE